MFALHLLGGALLEGRNGPVTGRAAHKRRLALLAILAAGRGRPVGRERVIGLLWPEHTTDAARHLLSESLYVLRKELGEAAFVSSGDEVALNGEVVRSDVQEFAAAVDEGDLVGAARVYRGPFMDGFYVSGALEFERWVESERDRLARAHTRALECLAEAGESAGRPQDAVEWWRRLAVADPYNSRVGVRLMLALDAAGERAASLWFAERHTALLREELGVEPDEEFAAAVERLRTEPVRFPPPSPPTVLSPTPPLPPPQDYAAGIEDPAGPTASIQAPAQPEPAPHAEVPAEPHSASPVEVRSRPEPAPHVEVHAEPHPAPPLDARVEPQPAAPAEATESAESDESAESAEPQPVEAAEPRSEPPAPAHAEPEPSSAVDVRAGRERSPGPEAVASSAAAPPATRRVSRWRNPVLQAGLLAGLVAAAVVLAFSALREEPARAAGYDVRRIAVLYFDDHSPGGELGYVASGLTEMLIHELSQVQALDVVSRNGVKPYRDTGVRFDSMVAELRVGSVVEGSVQRSGDSVRVTVQLIDAATNSHLESKTLLHPIAGVFALEDTVAREVSGFLRRRLGREIQLQQTRAGTRSEEAWRLVWQASEARDEARSPSRAQAPAGDPSRGRLLARSDSLLARAERADPGWTHPTLERGWVAYEAGRLADGPRAAALLRTAQDRADRVLAREPENARALELRGLVRFERAAAAGAGHEARADSAERDLRAAVTAQPSLASAWSRLSQLLRYRNRVAESDLAARRALHEDAYLDDAPAILNRLYFSAMLLGDYPQARSLCDGGRQRFPADWRFLECGLTLMREDRSRPPDPAAAWRLVAALDRLDPPGRAAAEGRAYSPVYRRALAAAILARAGERDSARAVLARARAAVEDDQERRLDLAYDEAYVLLLLGERDAARARLREVLAHRAWLREFARTDPLFRELLAPAPPATGSPTAGGTPPPRP
jgi:DNA-binding SARP family transcriptional activator/TolB-like protein